jgi:putative tricarboxylic transport membrane protein
MKAATGDFWSGLALAGLGAYIVVQAWGWEYTGADGPGPGFFPLWYGIAMAALSLFLVGSSLKTAEEERIDWSGGRRAFGVWLALVVAVAAVKYAGFAIAFAALTFFVVAWVYRKPFRTAAIVAILAAAAFHLVFALALGVKLP